MSMWVLCQSDHMVKETGKLKRLERGSDYIKYIQRDFNLKVTKMSMWL